MIVCAGDSESFEFATPVGIGLVESAINLTKIVLEKKPDLLIFIGSAGSYGKYKPLDLVESNYAVNIENSFLTGGSYTPIKSDVSRETIDIVNSSNYITTDFELSKLYRERNIELENMEFYSIFRVAKKFDIDIKGIFVVTNYCDKFAHKDFISNHNEAKNKLTEYVNENNIRFN
jgi:nucleoside phosphorylase